MKLTDFIFIGFILLIVIGMAERPAKPVPPSDLLAELTEEVRQYRMQQEDLLERLWRFHLYEFATLNDVVDPYRFVDALMVVSDDIRWELASICVQESHGRPGMVGEHGEKGAWQVREMYWGPVPATMQEQARQAARIYRELLSRNDGSRVLAMTAYNGSGKAAEQYAYEVISRVEGRID